MTPMSHEMLQLYQEGQLGPLWVTECYHHTKKATWPWPDNPGSYDLVFQIIP